LQVCSYLCLFQGYFQGFQVYVPLLGALGFWVFLLETLSFTSSFFQDVLDDDAQHIDVFLRLGGVQVTFGIFIRCFT
jgi:hypothetical protein